MDSSDWIFFLTAASASSLSLSLSTAWAFFSSSEKLLLLTFWAPRPPFLEASCKQAQGSTKCLNVFHTIRTWEEYIPFSWQRLASSSEERTALGRSEGRWSYTSYSFKMDESAREEHTPTWVCFRRGTQHVHTGTFLGITCMVWIHVSQGKQH